VVDGYPRARQATPLGWSPKGQMLISTRFGDVDQLHVVEQAAGDRRQLTFLHERSRRRSFRPTRAVYELLFLEGCGRQ